MSFLKGFFITLIIFTICIMILIEFCYNFKHIKSIIYSFMYKEGSLVSYIKYGDVHYGHIVRYNGE